MMKNNSQKGGTMKLLYWIKEVPWSFVCNVWWWMFHLPELHDADTDMSIILLKNHMVDIKWVKEHLSKYTYIPDKIDWRSWNITFIARGGGDCEDFAIFGVWLLGIIGIPAHVAHLRKKGTMVGHDICVADDNSVIISNNALINIGGEDPDRSILSYFGGGYDSIS